MAPKVLVGIGVLAWLFVLLQAANLIFGGVFYNVIYFAGWVVGHIVEAFQGIFGAVL